MVSEGLRVGSLLFFFFLFVALYPVHAGVYDIFTLAFRHEDDVRIFNF